MNKKVWILQVKRHVKKLGVDLASWNVGWYDLCGKRHSESCGPGARGKNQAEKRLRRIQSELDIGIHQPNSRKQWAEFQTEYDEQILSGLARKTREAAIDSLDHFKWIVKPGRVESIVTAMMDAFVAKRRKGKGRIPESVVSPATVNKDLRHIKAALRIAHDWDYLPDVPKVRMMKEPEKLPRYITPEHFDLIYSKACDLAKLPRNPGQHYSPTEWWRALTATAYMTGFRIGEILAIRKEDLNLSTGELMMRWDDTKADRDEIVPLHQVVVQHICAIVGKDDLVFVWCHDERTLRVEFARIQQVAGIHLTCRGSHKHTPACHVYGFHGFRKGFATVNAPRLKPEVLQRLMRHKSYQTTQKYYINPTSQMADAVSQMPVPGALKKGKWSRSRSGSGKN